MDYPAHFEFSNLPTPISPITRFFKTDRYNVWLKRDDMTGVELSGNKIRKLDFLIKDAVERGAERIVTCGGLQSNHCRATAFVCAQAGLKCTLVLRGEKPEILTGNYLLDRVVNADIELIDKETYKDVDTLMQRLADQSSEQCYIVPEGGSNEVGAWGYAKCFAEIQAQNERMDINIDTVIVGTGSGGTHAGLLAGKVIAGSDIEVLSVNVCDDAEYFEQKISRIIKNFEKRYQQTIDLDKNPVKIIDGYVGDGYGIISKEVIELISEFARMEGIVIDPVYGAKAMLGMKSLIESESLPGRNILFIHTGGIFGTFPFWQEFKF